MTSNQTGLPNGSRGAALWGYYGEDLDTPRGALACEACRVVNRIDELTVRLERNPGEHVSAAAEAMYRVGDIVETDDDRVLTITVDVSSMLNELRQQQTVLRSYLVTLEKMRAEASESDSEGGRPDDGKGSAEAATAFLDEFTSRRRAAGQ